jgi:hypothetical protein
MSWLLGLGTVVVGAPTRGDEVPALTIEGYTDRLSYQAGESIGFHVVTTSERFALEISRLGEKTESVLVRSNLAGTAAPIPENASSHGCNWPVSQDTGA